MKRTQWLTIGLFAFLLSAMLFASCKKNDIEQQQPDVAGLMAFNLAPDLDVVLTIGGNRLTNNPLSFTNFTGAYLGVYPGSREVAAFDYPSGDTVATSSYTFEANKYYSSFIVGSDSNYQNIIVDDNADSLSASSGMAYVRYVSAIPGVANPNVTITAGGTNVVNTNAAFATVSDFVAINPGDFTITVTEGSATNATRTIAVEAKKAYTVLLLAGADSTAGAQIRYITNGTVEDDAAKKVGLSARSAKLQ